MVHNGGHFQVEGGADGVVDLGSGGRGDEIVPTLIRAATLP